MCSSIEHELNSQHSKWLISHKLLYVTSIKPTDHALPIHVLDILTWKIKEIALYLSWNHSSVETETLMQLFDNVALGVSYFL